MNSHTINSALHDAECLIPDPGDGETIYVKQSLGTVELVSAGAETRTLGRPTRRGVVLSLWAKTIVGTITITVTGGYNSDGDTTFAMSAGDQFIIFQSFYDGSAYVWRKVTDYGLGNVTAAISAVLDAITATAAEINAVADVSGQRVLITDADTAIQAANSNKPHIIADVSADRTFTLPTPADGLMFEFVPKLNAADGHDWIFTTGSDTNYFTGGVIHLDTDSDAAGDELALVVPDGNSNSKLQVNLPQPGTRVRFICDGTLWNIDGQVVSTTAPTFADQ